MGGSLGLGLEVAAGVGVVPVDGVGDGDGDEGDGSPVQPATTPARSTRTAAARARREAFVGATVLRGCVGVVAGLPGMRGRYPRTWDAQFQPPVAVDTAMVAAAPCSPLGAGAVRVLTRHSRGAVLRRCVG